MARRILESIDGRRAVAEILLHAHGSEYLVTKLLYELHRAGSPEVIGVKHVEREVVAAPPRRAWGRDPPLPCLRRRGLRFWLRSPSRRRRTSTVAENADLELARRLLNRGEFDSALEILDRAYKAQPGDEALRRLLAEAEASFIEKAYRHFLPPNKIVMLVRPMELLTAERLSPSEFFLLSRIDGTWDVKSIIQITPIREVDVLRTLKRMREKGLIELKDPIEASA
jgi:hypothetical protein